MVSWRDRKGERLDLRKRLCMRRLWAQLEFAKRRLEGMKRCTLQEKCRGRRAVKVTADVDEGREL